MEQCKGMSVCPVFFFQAEDGIRDYKVTGVQTCALPIFGMEDPRVYHPIIEVGPVTLAPLLKTLQGRPAAKVQLLHFSGSFRAAELAQFLARSEERRVGKSVDLGGRRIIKKKKNKVT